MCDTGVIRWSADMYFFFFQAEDGIRDLVRSRGLGDVYKRQEHFFSGFVGLIDKTDVILERKLRINRHDAVAGLDLSLIHI